MASILDKYGIKEVADVTFYGINPDGTAGRPVLYLDTLKVSTIEQTGEQADARGGKGNPKLITWDYGKEITVTLEDALFSAKSMAIMFGDGTSKAVSDLRKTAVLTAAKTISTPSTLVSAAGLAAAVSVGSIKGLEQDNNKVYYRINNFKKVEVTDYTLVDEEGAQIKGDAVAEITAGKKLFITFNVDVTGRSIEISANTFPGTYYVTGDTYARSNVSGEDEFFQFVIKKAKVTSENTITLEAEGDPSTFSMNLTVLRPEDGSAMMELIKYDIDATADSTVVVDANTTYSDSASKAQSTVNVKG